MFCPNCGSEIKEGKKFCSNCGTKVKNYKTTTTSKIIPILGISVLTFCTILFLICYFLFFNNQNLTTNQVVVNTINKRNKIQQNVSKSKKNKKMASEILVEIKNYQARYWEIVKRHDTLLMTWSDDDKKKDREELDLLFEEVINKIDSNNKYLKRYYEIEKEFENNTGENTIEINEFASRHYKAVLSLINDVYKTVKSQISEEDFIELRADERKWLKEVNAYKKVFDAQEFGTIRTLIAYNYEINMQNFRALLLMLYL